MAVRTDAHIKIPLIMCCSRGNGADGVYRPEFLCQRSLCDWEGLHLTITFPGEEKEVTGEKSNLVHFGGD